ncbi:MAG: hypothetical protein K2X35_08270 [Bryobacteraceae bacterium]|nr:hypothetical protein [Bryobacteraceae bacterium]
MAAETVHGILRQAFLAPVVGDFPARRITFFTGMALILAIAWWLSPFLAAPHRRSRLLVGLAWAVLTLGFEVGLGVLLGYPAERIREDYDLRRGGLMGLGLLWMLFAPELAARLRAASPVRS